MEAVKQKFWAILEPTGKIAASSENVPFLYKSKKLAQKAVVWRFERWKERCSVIRVCVTVEETTQQPKDTE